MAKKETLRDWFSKNDGKGWVDCKTGKPCGRKSKTDTKRPYPACRPTKAQCTSAASKKTGPKAISWKKGRKKAAMGGEMLKNKSKADLNKDGNISSYERKIGMAIEKSMSQQNRVKKKMLAKSKQ